MSSDRKQCRACKEEINARASICPHCRTRQPGAVSKVCGWIGYGFLGLLMLSCVANLMGGDDSGKAPSAVAAPIPGATPPRVETTKAPKDAGSGRQLSLGTYYVTKFVDVHLGPSADSRITSHAERGQRTEVMEIRGEWARVSKYYAGEAEGLTAGEKVARWIHTGFLAKAKPEAGSRSTCSDPRIADDGLPMSGPGYAVSAEDVEIICLGAKKALREGCSRIDTADRSIHREGSYYVHCEGEARNRFFTVADLQR